MNITIIRPSILFVTHQMSRKKRKDPVGQTVRYAMMNYKVVLAGTYWYWASVSWYGNSFK